MVGLVILLADRISSGFFKPFFHRFRPTHDPEIMGLVDVVNGYRSGKYGFLSGHAANSFGVITFVSLLIRRKGFTFALIIWAALNCYSRIYLGVHFPGDILCGTLLGCLIGVLVYYLYRFLNKKIFSREYSHVIAHQNNKYTISDVKPILTVLYLSYFFIIVKALFWYIIQLFLVNVLMDIRGIFVFFLIHIGDLKRSFNFLKISSKSCFYLFFWLSL